MIDLVPEIKIIQRYIKLALDQRYTELRRNGLRLSDNKSLSQLLNARQFVLKQNLRSANTPYSGLILVIALKELAYRPALNNTKRVMIGRRMLNSRQSIKILPRNCCSQIDYRTERLAFLTMSVLLKNGNVSTEKRIHPAV